MTTILSAEDVRRLVMEPWCNECNAPIETLPDATHEHDNTHQALWARCPGCQPEGLEWRERGPGEVVPMELGWVLEGKAVPPNAVIDLILMSIARDGKKAFITPPQAIQQKYYDCLVDAVMSGDLPGAVAARHRLADLENKS